MLELTITKETLLSHPITPTGPIPTAQDPDGVYPYESFSETSHRPILKSFQFVSIENDHVKIVICPDLGGKVYSMIYKKSGKETLHSAPIVRPIRVLPRQFFIPGGIEVSFPISHSPVQLVPVLFKTEVYPDRLYVWCGERELRFGMQWTVEYSLGKKDAFLTQRTYFYNPTTQAHPWMSWSNAGIPAMDDTEFHFPRGPVLYHGEEMKTIDWEQEGPRQQHEMKRMAGFFWREPDCNCFGAYSPSLGSGLYHIADPTLTPGIKLWTEGVEQHKEYVTQATLNDLPCLEIQAGPIIDQSIKNELLPGGKHYHVEFWIPTDRPLDIYEISLPEPKLLPLEQIPLFSYARSEESGLWEALIACYQENRTANRPAPPDITDNRWAPSGIEQLELALKWAATISTEIEQSRWLFQLGSWYAGNDRIDEALEALGRSEDDRAFALAARLYRRIKQDFQAAAACYRSLKSPAFALHPQIVYERDLALTLLGAEALDERQYWLNETRSLKDEWLVERRAALLISQEKFMEAKLLLESTSFQLVHQRYARTKMWKQLMLQLNLSDENVPFTLGEDDLFEFGAYREYLEDEI